MVAKLRVGLALQPVATALFANSPFTDGKPNGYQSYRAEMWRDTDPDRTGLLPFAFEPAWASSAMSTTRSMCRCISSIATGAISTWPAPRSGIFSPASSRRCRASGRRSTIGPIISPRCFPMCRLKRFLEMRGADAGLLRPDPGAARAVGRTALRPAGARRRFGADPRLDRGRSCKLCATPFRGLGSRRRSAAAPCAMSAASMVDSGAWRLAAARPARPQGRGRAQGAGAARSRPSSRGARRPTACSPPITAPGKGDIDQLFAQHAHFTPALDRIGFRPLTI